LLNLIDLTFAAAKLLTADFAVVQTLYQIAVKLKQINEPMPSPFSLMPQALSPLPRGYPFRKSRCNAGLGWFSLIPQPLLPEREKGSRKSLPLAHFGKGEPKECGGLDEICVMASPRGEGL
jgi:hypothetical protein